MENFEMFLKTDIDIVEDTQATELYPVGIGSGGVRIHFMHYWIFLKRFEKLPHANKIVFTKIEYHEFKNVVFLKGYCNYAKFVEKFVDIPNI